MPYKSFLIVSFPDPVVWIFPLVIAIIGCVSILVAIFGFCGGTFECKILYFILVFLVVGSSIGVGSFWVNAKYNNQKFIDDSLRRAYSDYDRVEQKHLWQKLHRKFECCGVDGPMDFESAGRSIPNECFKQPWRLFYATAMPTRPTNGTKTTKKPSKHIIDMGCRSALSSRLILDRYIIGSISIIAGLLILLTLVASFFVLFDEGDVCEEYCPETTDCFDLDEYYDYSQCVPEHPCPVHGYCSPQISPQVCPKPPVPLCPTQPHQSCTIQLATPAPIPFQPAPACSAPVAAPPICMMILPQGTLPGTATPQNMVQQIIPVSVPAPIPAPAPPPAVIQEPQRPLQLQIPDMGLYI